MKYLLIAIFIFFNGICGAQNLIFSQVIWGSSFSGTVPAGKVWEIKSVSGGPNAAAFGGATYFSVTINGAGVPVVGYAAYGAPNPTGYQFNVLPIWLPAGTTVSGATFISIIEYTIGP
jgi:hypothetical protein